MIFQDISGAAISIQDTPETLRRKAEFLRVKKTGSLLQRKAEDADYTVLETDAGFHMSCDSVSDVTWTLNNDFPAGLWLIVSQLGPGRVVFSPVAPGLVESRATARTLDQFSQVRLDVLTNSTGTDAVWMVSGDIG